MRNVIEQGLAWALVVGIIGAVVLGRRRGKASLSAAVASAHAEGYAEGGRAAASAHADQRVTVAVDASRRDLALGGQSAHACSDPWVCGVCGPVLRRAAAGTLPSGRVASLDECGVLDDERAEYDHDRGNDYNVAEYVRAGRFHYDDASPASLPVGRDRVGADIGGSSDDLLGHGRVRGLTEKVKK